MFTAPFPSPSLSLSAPAYSLLGALDGLSESSHHLAGDKACAGIESDLHAGNLFVYVLHELQGGVREKERC